VSRGWFAVAVAVALLVASVVDPRWIGASGVARTPGLTTALHLFGYAAFGTAVVAVVGIDRWWVAVVVSAAYGAFVELLQFGLAYRTAGLVDAGVNGVGAAVGVALWWIAVRARRRTAND
jgi:VanZ family protein